MGFDETKTYWSQNGKHEKKLAALHQLIDATLIWEKPYRAKMPKAYSGGKNYNLERLRTAKNAYYRWYNDGDKNQIFSRALKNCYYHNDGVETVINQKIEAAWQEQYGEAA